MDQSQKGRSNNWIWIVLILLHLVLPAPALLARITGYLVWMPIPWLWPLVVTLCTVCAAVFLKKPNGSRILWLLPILAVGNGLLLCFHRDLSDAPLGALLFTAPDLIAAMVLCSRSAAPKWLRRVSGVISCVPATAMSALLLFFVMFSFGESTDLQTIPSPDGERCAVIVDADFGGTGGNTLVEVRDAHPVNLLFFGLRRPTIQLYSGPWGEWDSLAVAWESDTVLEIKGQSYSLDDGDLEEDFITAARNQLCR